MATKKKKKDVRHRSMPTITQLVMESVIRDSSQAVLDVYRRGRIKFETLMKEKHGCNYVDHICTVHGDQHRDWEKTKVARRKK
jgi:hypothetical protein